MASVISIKGAVEAVCRLIGQYPEAIKKINDGRYALIRIKNNRWFLVSFKREFYHSFNQVKEGAGYGETINAETIEECKQKKISTIFIVHNTGKIYKTSREEIEQNGVLRTTKAEDKEVYSFNLRENLEAMN